MTFLYMHIQNDIWQAQTWASLEYSGQWKILHYYLRDAFKQLSVSSLAEDNGVGIYVIVDASDKDVKYDLTVQVMSWKVRVCVCVCVCVRMCVRACVHVFVWKTNHTI